MKDMRRLIERVAGARKISMRKAEPVVREVFRQLPGLLAEQGEIAFNSFGRIAIKKCRPRQAHDFKTGERIVLAGTEVLKFTPGSATRRALGRRR